MNLKTVTSLLALGISFIACTTSDPKVTDPNDYTMYLESNDTSALKNAQLRLNFWNGKLDADTTRIMAIHPVSTAYSQLFQITGDIKYLKNAEKILRKGVTIAAIKKEGYLLALARNYISQHRFLEAESRAIEALSLDQNKKETQMVLFDIAMELGNYLEAEQYLHQFADQKDFNFLIRLAKWNDYKGNLDATIKYMEKAKVIAVQSKDDELMLWTYTNLADYYGHAGNLKASYAHYLKALAIDPSNAYAKKGIAWIVYSHEHNTQEAGRIIVSVMQTHQSPDYHLFKAELAEFENKAITKEREIQAFLKVVKEDSYGDMYNIPVALLIAEEHSKFDEALALAQKEVANRPTPQTYDLLAYIYHLKGDHKKALTIVEDHIADKTFEPEAQFHIAEVYKSNKLEYKVLPIKESLLESTYELGPVLAKRIQKL
ncbi:tetratricopeptide repeat protein [Aquimarina sp. 2-A2]|uniref:tetratricopeptide repeat protein n=1 Tax=Aquimarina sp. 2-A2 TaxID=3382644 RepID=UPI00387EF3A4